MWSRKLWKDSSYHLICMTTNASVYLALKPVARQGNIKAGVYPRTINNTDSVYFSDSSDFAEKRRWNFSDGYVSLNASGYHKFKHRCLYCFILTINNKHKDTFQIMVNRAVSAFNIQDSLINIEGSQLVNVDEKDFFRVKGMANTKLFTWTFGGSGERITSSNRKPAHVAGDLDAVIVILLEPQSAVFLDVADRRHLELEQAEAPREGDLLVAGKKLAWKDQQSAYLSQSVEFLHGNVVEVRNSEKPGTTAAEVASMGSPVRGVPLSFLPMFDLDL